jgi:hypothetical protein
MCIGEFVSFNVYRNSLFVPKINHSIMVIMMKLNGLLKFLIFKSDICKFSDSIDFGINQKFFLIYKRKIRLYYVYEEKIFYICPYFYQNEHF